MPNKPNKRERDTESTCQRIPNKDSENDPKSLKQIVVTDKQPGDKA